MKYPYTRSRLTGLVLAGILTLGLSAATVPAQDAAQGQAPLVEDAAAAQSRSFLQMLLSGGWAMIPLGILSVATLGLAGYNFSALRRKNYVNDELVAQLEEAVGQLDIETAKQLCEQNPGPMTNTLRAGLHEIQDGYFDPEMVERAIESSSEKEFSGPYIMVSYISIIAAIAPMLGLLGTVSGMVKAFNNIALQGMGKPELLADNISEALITTATGMAIGIPAMFFFFVLKNRYGALVADISVALGYIMNRLKRAAGTTAR